MTAIASPYTPYDPDTTPFWDQLDVPVECLLEVSHDEIKKSIYNCQACSFGKLTKPLYLSNSSGSIMIVGERPDDVMFETRTGKKLGELIEQSKLPLEELYLTSLIKCQESTNPLQCHHHLIGEIMTVRPMLVIALGYNVALMFTQQPSVNTYAPIGFTKSTIFMTYSMQDLLQDTAGQMQLLMVQHFSYIAGQIRGMKTA